jgi:hypothetical protein
MQALSYLSAILTYPTGDRESRARNDAIGQLQLHTQETSTRPRTTAMRRHLRLKCRQEPEKCRYRSDHGSD